MTDVATRTRLKPEQRREQLLDCARQLIADQGLSSVTMEDIAKQAGVSNPLVYKYFDTRMALLQALFQREYDAYYLSIRDRLKHASDLQDAVRVFVEANFEQFARGNVLNILNGQPDIRAVVRRKETKRARQAQRFLVDSLINAHALSRPAAEHLVAVGSSASIGSAEHFNRRGGNREDMIDNTVTFILSGIESVVSAE